MTAIWFCVVLFFSCLACFVSYKKETVDVMEHKPDPTGSIQDCTYLSSEKDVGLWKMLVASPTNRNVFVGGLSQGVTSEILHKAFEAFVLRREEKNRLKVMVT